MECKKNKYVEQCNFYLCSKKPKNSNRVKFSNIIDTIASNETHIARFEYLYELTNKIYCGPIHCRIKSKPRINIRSMKDRTQMPFFGKFDGFKRGQIVRDADKKGGFFSISEDRKLVCDFGFSFSYVCCFGMEHANGKKVGRIW